MSDATDQAARRQRFDLGGVDVLVEGDGASTLLMIHGWPDTHRLWDAQVAHFERRWRCVRFTLPGFDLAKPRRTATLDQLVALLLAIADRASPDRPVTLVMHDWGCVFGYEFAARHPARVAGVVSIDVGDVNSAAFARTLSAGQKLGVLGYQVWNALAWLVGGGIGDRMMRAMARRRGCPTDPRSIGASMGWPYAMRWFGVAGGLGKLAPVSPPRHPVLYLHGTRRSSKWHSPEWLALLDRSPVSAHEGFDTSHWIMLDAPEAFNASVERWLGHDAEGG